MPTKATISMFTLSPAIVAMMTIVPNLQATSKLPVSIATTSCETCKTGAGHALCTPNQLHPVLHDIQTG